MREMSAGKRIALARKLVALYDEAMRDWVSKERETDRLCHELDLPGSGTVIARWVQVVCDAIPRARMGYSGRDLWFTGNPLADKPPALVAASKWKALPASYKMRFPVTKISDKDLPLFRIAAAGAFDGDASSQQACERILKKYGIKVPSFK